MNFTSPLFLFVCMPLWVIFYYLLQGGEHCFPILKKIEIKDWFLAIVSIGFYSWSGVVNALKLCVYIIAVYCMGNLIEKGRKDNGRLGFVLLLVGCVGSVLTLCFFKYMNAIESMFIDFFNKDMHFKSMIAPLGISFITFSALSYIIDIYRGSAKAGTFREAVLYISFFPKVVSGPIILWKDFAIKISNRNIDSEKLLNGINRIAIGLSKKVILADTLGTVVQKIQNQTINGIDGITAWGCAFLYMLQIYYDFSGYSDVAIGLSGLFGFEVDDNFNFPYTSLSITEFWKRWHISLGKWFKEYIYFPLGGNRKGSGRTLLNLFIVFLVTGIWHGSGWKYLCWGIMHGICCIIERCVKGKLWYQRIPKFLRWISTMFIVMIGWETFRLESLGAVRDFIQIMFGFRTFSSITFTYNYFFSYKVVCMIIIAVVGSTLFSKEIFKRELEKLKKLPLFFCMQESLILILMILSIICMTNSTYSPFIYFQY